MRIKGEGRALAHRQQAGDGVDFAIGQDHARDRAVTKLSGLGMKLRRRGYLLAQIGRGVDQEPVRTIGADGDRGLRAPEFGAFGSRHQAHRTTAIPLRNTATCCGAQDDDAKHDPSPGESELGGTKTGSQNATRWTPASNTAPLSDRVRPRRSTCVKRRTIGAGYLRAAHAYMLISMPTGTSTIFGAFQAIWLSFCCRTDSALEGKVLRIKKFASGIFLPYVSACLCCVAKQFTLLCGGPLPKGREIKR